MCRITSSSSSPLTYAPSPHSYLLYPLPPLPSIRYMCTQEFQENVGDITYEYKQMENCLADAVEVGVGPIGGTSEEITNLAARMDGIREKAHALSALREASRLGIQADLRQALVLVRDQVIDSAVSADSAEKAASSGGQEGGQSAGKAKKVTAIVEDINKKTLDQADAATENNNIMKDTAFQRMVSQNSIPKYCRSCVHEALAVLARIETEHAIIDVCIKRLDAFMLTRAKVLNDNPEAVHSAQELLSAKIEDFAKSSAVAFERLYANTNSNDSALIDSASASDYDKGQGQFSSVSTSTMCAMLTAAYEGLQRWRGQYWAKVVLKVSVMEEGLQALRGLSQEGEGSARIDSEHHHRIHRYAIVRGLIRHVHV